MINLNSALTAILTIDPDADAIECGGKWASWGDLDTTIASLRKSLDDIGCGADTRVGVMLRNQAPQIAALLGVMSSNCCIVTLNSMLPDDKLARDIETLNLPVIVGAMADMNRPGLTEALERAGCAIISLPEEMGQPVNVVRAEINGDGIRRTDPGVVVEMLTSGTTGAPKRIPLSRKRFEKSLAAAMGFEQNRSPYDKPQLREGVTLISAPLVHISGVWHIVNAVLAGRRSCVMEKFSVDQWSEAVVRHRPKVTNCPPSALRMLLDAGLPADTFKSLRAIRAGTAPLDPAIVDEFLERYNLPILQAYGATEFAGSIAGWSLGAFRDHYRKKEGSVGRLNPGIQGRIISLDDGASILRCGEEGVLEVRGGQIGKDWVRTTDRAILDEDDYLWIKGRADNAIIRGGFKIHAEEIVNVLRKHPVVREAVVVGIKDRRLGEVPVAALIPRHSRSLPSDEELKEFLRDYLVPYQIPVKFRFVDEVPRTPSMKPCLPDVKALFTTKNNSDHAA